jgi:hypothetical protein
LLTRRFVFILNVRLPKRLGSGAAMGYAGCQEDCCA